MTTSSNATAAPSLDGQRVALVGKLAGLSRREAKQLLRRHGGVPVEKLDASVDLVVVGENELPLDDTGQLSEMFDDAIRLAAERGSLSVVTETDLWRRLGLVDGQQNIHRLYTPRMLAALVDVPIEVIRRWHRRGLIVPVREVLRLAYFDFQEVATARRLAELLAAGVSPRAIEAKLAELRRLMPRVERPLAQLSVIVQGKDILLRQGDGLVEPGGQRRFDFETSAQFGGETAAEESPVATLPLAADATQGEVASTPEELVEVAVELEDLGQTKAAVEVYRAALVAGGPDAEICFRLAELLYRLGDLTAARERYYMAIEMDESFVEARANLGCVLAETGEHELAVAAFQGTLSHHGTYPDVHFHLARTYDELGHPAEAEEHWRAFLGLAPDSPWAEAAWRRLESNETT